MFKELSEPSHRLFGIANKKSVTETAYYTDKWRKSTTTKKHKWISWFKSVAKLLNHSFALIFVFMVYNQIFKYSVFHASLNCNGMIFSVFNFYKLEIFSFFERDWEWKSCVFPNNLCVWFRFQPFFYIIQHYLNNKKKRKKKKTVFGIFHNSKN